MHGGIGRIVIIDGMPEFTDRACAMMRPLKCSKHRLMMVVAPGRNVKRCPQCVAKAKAKVKIERERYFRVNAHARVLHQLWLDKSEQR